MKNEGHAVGWCSDTEAIIGMYLQGAEVMSTTLVGALDDKLTSSRNQCPTESRTARSRVQSSPCTSDQRTQEHLEGQ